MIGRAEGEPSPHPFAIDRIESVDVVRSGDGTPVGFAYPREDDDRTLG